MDIQINQHPFDFLVIDNLYDQKELELIWKEIELFYPNLLLPENTGSARDPSGKLLKKNLGVFLDNVYHERFFSNILKINRKIFHTDIVRSMQSLNPFYRLFPQTNNDSTLLNYYSDEGYYEPHSDHSLFTAVTVLYREPIGFSGGDFVFSEYEHLIEKKNNRVIIFPGVVKHSVTPVHVFKNTDFAGRFSLSQFINFTGQVLIRPDNSNT